MTISELTEWRGSSDELYPLSLFGDDVMYRTYAHPAGRQVLVVYWEDRGSWVGLSQYGAQVIDNHIQLSSYSLHIACSESRDVTLARLMRWYR